MSPATTKGIFCLEGDWHRCLDDRASVLPTSEMLEQLGLAKFIHRDVATKRSCTTTFASGRNGAMADTTSSTSPFMAWKEDSKSAEGRCRSTV